MLLNHIPKIMEAFETTLTGSDGSIDGIVTHISNEAYQFTSLDNSLHLTIAKNAKGKWIRLSGSEPYFAGWVDELSEHIATYIKVAVKPTVAKKVPVAVAEKKVTPAKKVSAVTKVSKATVSEPVKKAKAKTATPSVKKPTTKAESDKKITAKTVPVKKAKVSSSATKK